MAYESFIPGSLALDVDDVIREAYPYRRVFTVTKKVGTADVPVNMAEYANLAPVIIFKDKDTESGGVLTNSPIGVCAWVDAAAGTYQLDLTAAETNVATGAGSLQRFEGFYEIYATHNTETELPSTTPKTTVMHEGGWKIKKTLKAA